MLNNKGDMKENSIIKIALIIIAVCISIAAILVFQNTIIGPPKAIKFENIHRVYLAQVINEVGEDSTEFKYSEALFLIRRYGMEQLVENNDIDEKKELLMDVYVPLFIDKCNKAFDSSVWDTPQWSNEFMLSRVEEIKNLKSSSGSFIIERNSEYIKRIKEIEEIIYRYNSAWNFINNASKCSSVAEIKSLKASADKFRTPPLDNCTKLMQTLNSVESTAKANLASNIASFCNNIANKWRTYGSYPKWLSAYDGACSRINEYTKAFGNSSILSQSKAKLDMAKQSALDYYD